MDEQELYRRIRETCKRLSEQRNETAAAEVSSGGDLIEEAAQPAGVEALDQVFASLRVRGWTPGLEPELYEGIACCGFRQKLLPLAIVATEILSEEQPMSLRGLFYRVVSAGWLPDTDRDTTRHSDG